MRTSIDIPDPLLRRVKKLARQKGTTLRQLVIDGLRQVIGTASAPSAYRVEDCSFGTGGLVDGLTWTDTDAIRTLTYEERGG